MRNAHRILPVLLPVLLAGPLVGGLAGARPSSAATTPDPQAVPTLSDSARVSLISILPGDRIYSVFGHSALRIRDPGLGIDRAYNFGTFDFGRTPLDVASFVGRFTYGDLNYSLTVQDPVAMVRRYWQIEDRASTEQVLDLTRDEAQELFRRLEINALPENRHYQYDFFFDNCATRLLDALEGVLGPDLTFPGARSSGLSFRRLLDRYLVGQRWIDLGMDLGLGAPADREATAREATFLPEYLMEYVGAGRLDQGGEDARPLVRSTRALTGAPADDWTPESDPPWPLIATGALLLVGLALTIRDVRSKRADRSPEARGERGSGHRLDALFFGVLGVAGLALVFLWFVSLHDVTDTNFNLAWALPTHLVLAVALWRGSAGRRTGVYLVATAGLAALLLLGMIGSIWPQELPVALGPLLLLIAVRAGWLGWVRTSASPPSRP